MRAMVRLVMRTAAKAKHVSLFPSDLSALSALLLKPPPTNLFAGERFDHLGRSIVTAIESRVLRTLLLSS